MSNEPESTPSSRSESSHVAQELTGIGYLARALAKRLAEKQLGEADMATDLADKIENALRKVAASSDKCV